MKIRENDKIPNSEIFVLEGGDPVKKNINRALYFFLSITNQKIIIIFDSIKKNINRSLYLNYFRLN